MNIPKSKRHEEIYIGENDIAQKYLDIAGVMFIAIDDKECVTLINQKGCEILGYTEDEILGKNWFDLCLPNTIRDEIRSVYQNLLAGNVEPMEYYENQVITKTGEERIISWHNTVLRNESGKIIGSLGSGEDITQRKITEYALKKSEEKYRALVENANDAIFVIQDGSICFNNKKAEEFSGYTQEEIHELSFLDAIHPEDRGMVMDNHYRRLNGEEFEHIYPIRLLTKNGQQKWGEINAIKIDWNDKPAVLCCIRDISQQKELETQFHHAQKMEAVGILAGGIAHDFNNLLTSIIGNISLAQDMLEKDHPVRKDLEDVEKAAGKASSLTRKLLSFSKKQVVIPEIVNVNNLIKQSDKILKHLINEDIYLHKDLAADLVNVKADPQQIEHALVNIVVNANEAMPHGGKLMIQTNNIDLDIYYLNAHGVKNPPGTYVMISISDTGKGMDEKTQSRIFEPFFSTKEVGKSSGLGLPTVHGIVKQSGGFIRVYSEIGIGTTFKIYLPKFEKDTSKTENIPQKALEGSETILVAEDNDMILKLSDRILNSLGYNVLLANNGEEALTISKDFNKPIDLLLTDVIMPGMNGMELAQQLKFNRDETKVLFMSGYTGSKIFHDNILELGMAFITKPFTKDSLSLKIRQILDASGSQSE